MATILGRPSAIQSHHCITQFPADNSDVTPTRPSLFTFKIIEYKLAAIVSECDSPNRGVQSLRRLIRKLSEFKSTLPPCFQFDNPTVENDSLQLAYQRQNLLFDYYIFVCALHRSYMFFIEGSDISNADYEQHLESIRDGTVAARKVLEATETLFNLAKPYRRRWFRLTFYTFDAATLICAVLLKRDSWPSTPYSAMDPDDNSKMIALDDMTLLNDFERAMHRLSILKDEMNPLAEKSFSVLRTLYLQIVVAVVGESSSILTHFTKQSIDPARELGRRRTISLSGVSLLGHKAIRFKVIGRSSGYG